jgi:choline dehydrogenase-like flavoprotein
MAAWNLTRQGTKVLMLDAGTKFPRSQYWSHVKPWQAQQKIAAGQRPPQIEMMQAASSRELHDVVIVGSGASGGMAAWNLTRQGTKVLMLDAGTKFPRPQY